MKASPHSGTWRQCCAGLITEKTYEVSADLVEISEATMKVNAAVDALRQMRTRRTNTCAIRLVKQCACLSDEYQASSP